MGVISAPKIEKEKRKKKYRLEEIVAPTFPILVRTVHS